MNYFVLTNNPLVKEQAAPGAETVYKECGFKQILQEAALYVASGHQLLTHPLSGSVKPGETPYKSMLLATDAQSTMDTTSAQLISHAIESCDKFSDRSARYDERTLRDLQLVDKALIGSALESANR